MDFYVHYSRNPTLNNSSSVVITSNKTSHEKSSSQVMMGEKKTNKRNHHKRNNHQLQEQNNNYSMMSKVVKLSTDPQSVTARQRRHRISEKLKILRSMIPGSDTKNMDTVTMLEEAIQYVKLLKSQIWLHQTTLISFQNNNYHDDNVYDQASADHHHHLFTCDHDGDYYYHHHQLSSSSCLPKMERFSEESSNYCFKDNNINWFTLS